MLDLRIQPGFMILLRIQVSDTLRDFRSIVDEAGVVNRVNLGLQVFVDMG